MLSQRLQHSSRASHGLLHSCNVVCPPLSHGHIQFKSSSSGRHNSVVCLAERPMWAAKAPAQSPSAPPGYDLSRMMTDQIADCKTLRDLENVCAEWSSSFGYVQVSASLVRYARLAKRSKNLSLYKRLINLWLQVLPDAFTRQCSNVLWAFGSVGVVDRQVWDSTWEQYISNVQRDLSYTNGVPVPAQEISSVLWACGKLNKQPSPDELQLLLQAFLHRAVLETAAPQALSNVLLALTQLRQLKSWEAQVTEQQLQSLLGEQQLTSLASSGTPQAVSNVLLAVGRLATGPQPLLSLKPAQHCVIQLLPTAIRGARTVWNPPDVSIAVFACGQLRMHETDSQLDQFLAAVARAAPRWCPTANNINIQQIAHACVQLGYSDTAMMQQMLKRSMQLLQPPTGSRRLAAEQADSLATNCIWAVTQLGMPQLVPTALEALAISGIGSRSGTHPSNLRRLWESHTWLLQQDQQHGKGLAGIVRQDLLLQGRRQAAEHTYP